MMVWPPPGNDAAVTVVVVTPPPTPPPWSCASIDRNRSSSPTRSRCSAMSCKFKSLTWPDTNTSSSEPRILVSETKDRNSFQLDIQKIQLKDTLSVIDWFNTIRDALIQPRKNTDIIFRGIERICYKFDIATYLLVRKITYILSTFSLKWIYLIKLTSFSDNTFLLELWRSVVTLESLLTES